MISLLLEMVNNGETPIWMDPLFYLFTRQLNIMKFISLLYHDTCIVACHYKYQNVRPEEV